MNLPAIAQQRGITPEVWSAMTNSLFPGAREESVALVWDYCKARKLDPLKKPCHIVPMSVKDAKTGNNEWRDVIMPGIYELRITAQRTGEYAGQDAPVFGPMSDINIGGQKVSAPEFCTVTVYRLMQGQRIGTSHTEFYEEAVGTKKDGKPNSMWLKRKRGQLAKTAEAGALRKAFPDELGGQMSADEMEGKQIDQSGEESPIIESVVLISDEQANSLHSMITENDLDLDRWLGWVESKTGQPTLQSIPETSYLKVESAINQAITQKSEVAQ